MIAETFDFDGLVKGGAPVVVEFLHPEDGFLRLDVAVKKKKQDQTFRFQPAETATWGFRARRDFERAVSVRRLRRPWQR